VSEVELPHLRKLADSLVATQREGDDLHIPLRSGVRPRGLLVLRLPRLSAETADALASLVSLALDRAQALENLARGEAAKESERLRTLMIDSITHELRTPLTSIKGAATTLLSSGSSTDDAKELLTIIDEESDRLNRLVSEAVEMSQLDAQQVRMHMAVATVQELVVDAIDACSWIRAQHEVSVLVPPQLRVLVDPAFLQKALCNLLENAAKYSGKGTPITVSAEAMQDRVAISVADQGVGIDDSEQALVFERFYRSRNRISHAAGTGMGLAISRAVVHAHGGDITVTSQPSRGSVFTILLPAAGA
jgi:two-component system, OmpR family, sensor histidine kinase KdpD